VAADDLVGAVVPRGDAVCDGHRYTIWLSGGQGIMQLAMILIMARFRFGLS
jgi:hypothetical protein